MADHEGAIPQRVVGGKATNLASGMYAPFSKISPSGSLSSTTIGGPHTKSNSKQEFPKSHSGAIADSYKNIFYYRILIEPKFFDVGNLVSQQTRTFKVFNAYFNDVDLLSINASNDGGILLSGPSAPRTMAQLQELEYEITLPTDGPTDINAEYLFDFQAGYEDQVVSVVGSRVVLFPYWFRAAMTEKLSWSTEIITSKNGTEQRIRKRQNPIQSFTGEIFLSRNEVTRADILIAGWRNRNWALPVWSESRVGEEVNIGDSSVTVDTANADFRVGSLCVIWASPRKFEILEVTAITSNSITFDRQSNKYFSSPFVAPARIARMSSDPVRDFNGFSGQSSVSFDVVDNTSLTGGDQPIQHNGLDVYLGPANLPASSTYINPIDVISYGTGKTESFTTWDYTKIETQFLVAIDSQGEAWEFKKFMHKLAGRAIGFYMPTFENNLRLLSSGVIAAVIIIVDDDQSTQALDRTSIAINLNNGNWLFRDITSIAKDNDGNLEVVLDSPINLDASEIKFISYMGEKRLSSDDVTIEWGANNKATCTMSITEYQT
jgi:hypothetical protein